MKAKLILENGMIFEGEAFGDLTSKVGEVVFNTGMTGYQEILTDPSYYGQIVTMTYPLIGNYGINLDDLESKTPKVRGFVVREKCDASSNFRSEFELDDYLKMHNIIGIEGIDTRALTKLLRSSGTMKGVITTEALSHAHLQHYFDGYVNTDAVYQVTINEMYTLPAESADAPRVAIMDFGIKQSIIKYFKENTCHITVYPAQTKAEEILEDHPDMIFLSNGPGDPSDLPAVIDEVKKFIGVKPITGICLGHQLLALALGGKTEKLKFGHRGCNHPVKDLEINRVVITSQNHGYYVSELPEDMAITHVSLNDGTVEGMRHKTLPIFSVQYHPEASPGPVDSIYLFESFLKLAKKECSNATK